VSPEALHVTLAFLGHRPESEIEPIARAVEASLDGLSPARLTPRGTRPVPPRRPRLFALDLEDGEHTAAAVHHAVAAALEQQGFYTPERRTFWPHVTVARVRSGHTRPQPPQPSPPAQPFTASEVTLYRSRLGGGPARYEKLKTWPLSAMPHSRA
jgi:2'-5' RNA ligase